MTTQQNIKQSENIDWHALDETDSEDDSDSSSDSEGLKSDKEEEESKGRHHHHHHHNNYRDRYDNRSGYNNRDRYNKRDGYNNRSGYNNRDGYKQNYNTGFQQGDPNSNYAQYYRNDPDFFVKVMEKEDPPHQLCVKVSKRRDENPKDLSIEDLTKVLEEFGVTNPDITVNKYGDFRATIEIQTSEECVKIYSDLFDNLNKKMRGYYTKVFYQRDIKVLEKYGDEEAEAYHTKQKDALREKTDTSSYHKSGKQYNDHRHGNKFTDRDDRHGYKHNDRHGNMKHYRDDKKPHWKDHHQEKENAASTLPGFGSSSGPKMFFNKHKKTSDLGKSSSKEVTKSPPVEDSKNTTTEDSSKKEIQVENNDEKKEKPIEKVNPETNKEEISEPKMKKRDTDKEFDIEKLHSDPPKKEHRGYVKPETGLKPKMEEGTAIIKPRHQVRGKRGIRAGRKPYANRFAMLIDAHIDDDQESLEESNSNEEDKPTLIGDRPETEKFGKVAEIHHKKYHAGRFHKNNWNDQPAYKPFRDHKNGGRFQDTRSTRGGYIDRGRYNKRGSGHFRNRGGRINNYRGGYHKRGGQNYDSMTNFDKRSEHNDKLEVESTNSHKGWKEKY